MDNATAAAAVSSAATAAAGGVGEMENECLTNGRGGDEASTTKEDACAA